MLDEVLTRLGMPIPDSAVARRARELIAAVASPSLVNHSVRSYAWAVELARHDRLGFDPEILYVSAMLQETRPASTSPASATPTFDRRSSPRCSPRIRGSTSSASSRRSSSTIS